MSWSTGIIMVIIFGEYVRFLEETFKCNVVPEIFSFFGRGGFGILKLLTFLRVDYFG
jgi:hypothetical protein